MQTVLLVVMGLFSWVKRVLTWVRFQKWDINIMSATSVPKYLFGGCTRGLSSDLATAKLTTLRWTWLGNTTTESIRARRRYCSSTEKVKLHPLLAGTAGASSQKTEGVLVLLKEGSSLTYAPWERAKWGKTSTLRFARKCEQHVGQRRRTPATEAKLGGSLVGRKPLFGRDRGESGSFLKGS